ncbi:MAG TPA: hypothetical protein VGH40_05345 [Roseiarcus sp.]|jgi:hypothetical protein
MRPTYILFCLLVGGAAAYYGQPCMHGNGDAITIMITVFTVFAGFLIAIMTLIGDPSFVPGDNWRSIEVNREDILDRLILHSGLFMLYFIAIGLLFTGVLIEKAPAAVISEDIKVWIDRAYLFFGVSAFTLSFALPVTLIKFQMARLSAETESRRQGAGIQA